MRSIALVVVVSVIVWGVPVGRQGATLPALAGTYAVTGTGPNGSYQGRAVVVQRGRVIFLQWQLPPSEQYQGFGLIVGDKLAASYAIGNVGAIIVYDIDGKRLIGEWPDLAGELHDERLVKQDGI